VPRVPPAIFDDDALAELGREPVEHEARHHVGSAARAERDRRLDDVRWIRAGGLGVRCERQEAGGQQRQ